MVRVVDQERVVIQEHGLSFLERNAMFFPVRAILRIVPFDPKVSHPYSVATS
jgi:hypothetical protein